MIHECSVIVCGITLWYSNGNYYQQSLDSDVGIITNIESVLFKSNGDN